jgi:nitrite reductase/ring-hydroxylating ferredoxin subunit
VRSLENMIGNPCFKYGVGVIVGKARQSKIVRDGIVRGSQNLKCQIVNLKYFCRTGRTLEAKDNSLVTLPVAVWFHTCGY